jgi:hypothetical protein
MTVPFARSVPGVSKPVKASRSEKRTQRGPGFLSRHLRQKASGEAWRCRGATRSANGPDAALWFTEASGNKIGRITTAGTDPRNTVTSQQSPSNRCYGL